MLAIATRIAQIPTDIVQINKRTVHRAMEVMGLRPSIRAGTELCALATHTESMQEFMADIQASGLTDTLTKRDTPFGDYRTAEARVSNVRAASRLSGFALERH